MERPRDESGVIPRMTCSVSNAFLKMVFTLPSLQRHLSDL
jgi:hypothetical protein